MLSFKCPLCHKSLKVQEAHAGKTVKCPGCGKGIAIPTAGHAGKPSVPRANPGDLPTIPPVSVAGQTGEERDVSVPEAGSDPDLTDFLAPPQTSDEIGRLGPYRVLKVLGAGGMGVVFKAEDPQLQRFVALKAILPSCGASSAARERFLREARAGAALKHDHIVSIYQVGVDRNVPFLAMEFLDGEALDERLRREGRLSLAEVLRIGRETAEGLEAAHEKGMIHRDIKPANLWLEGKRQRVKILDFGLARTGAEASHLTRTGAIMGTPAFMAPEQAQGKSLDHRCDLFSLGCVLYRMTTGKMPFQGTDAISTLMAVSTETPPAPRALCADVPPDLSDLIMRLLAKKPEDRPASARAVAEAIESMTRDATVAMTRPNPVPATAKPAAFAGRSQRVLLAAVVLIAFLAPGAFLAWRLSSARKEPARVVFQPLFNGKDMDGWETHPVQPGGWTVEDGCLVGRSNNANHLFYTRDDYENFHLRARVRINKDGNSGIYFRGTYGLDRGNRFPDAYEAQILNSYPKPDVHLTGSLPRFTKVEKSLVGHDEWFAMDVIARGNRIVIKVNGTTTADFIDLKNTYRRPGRLILQAMSDKNVNFQTTVVQFQSIEIREFPSFPAVPRKGPNGWPVQKWMSKHEEFTATARKGGIRVLFLGDALTAGLKGKEGKSTWEQRFAPLGADAFGVSGDRIENLLWRVENGELEGIAPAVAVLLIGTNNTAADSAEKIARGVTVLVETIRDRLPATRVLVLGVFPRDGKAELHQKILAVNRILARLDDGRDVRFLDLGPKLKGPDGTVSLDVMLDGLHLSARGYEIWAEGMLPLLTDMLKR